MGVLTAPVKSKVFLSLKCSTCLLLEVLWINNTLSLPLTKKLDVRWLTVLKILRGLAAENTHTDSFTNLCLENEVAVEDKLLIPLYKNVARIMWPGLPVNLFKKLKLLIFMLYFYVCTAC